MDRIIHHPGLTCLCSIFSHSLFSQAFPYCWLFQGPWAFSFLFFLFFSFYYSWLMVLVHYSKVTPSYLYTQSLILSSIMVYPKRLDIVPCAVQQDLSWAFSNSIVPSAFPHPHPIFLGCLNSCSHSKTQGSSRCGSAEMNPTSIHEDVG